jgi:hypothetical protein
MCRCTPSLRTPFCGKPGCELPKQTPAGKPGFDVDGIPDKVMEGLARALARADGILDPDARVYQSLNGSNELARLPGGRGCHVPHPNAICPAWQLYAHLANTALVYLKAALT